MDSPQPSMDQAESSFVPGIPQTCDAQKTKELSDLVGIPLIDLGVIVEDAVSSHSEKEDEEEGLTMVLGKRPSPSKISEPSSSSKDLLQLTIDDVASEVKYWETAVVCYVLGGNPPWELLQGFVQKLWGVYKFDKILFFPNGVFLVRFPTLECQNLVLQQGFPMFDNKPLVVKPWTEDCTFQKERVNHVPIWLRLCGLPLKFWGKSSLEKLAGLLGKFLKRDAATKNKTRLGYARLLVEVEVGQEFPDKLYFKDEKGSEISILVEYEWKPIVCGSCKGIGHSQEACKKRQTPEPKPKGQQVPGAKPVQKIWRPIQKPVTAAPPVVPVSQGRTTPEHPFGGIVHHNSALLTPVTILQQVISQEHQVAHSHRSPSKSYAEAITESSKGKGKVNGGLEEPPGLQGINNNLYHNGGRVWLIWNPQVFKVDVLHIDDQVISSQVFEIATVDKFYFSVVYGHNDDDQRLPLWSHLKDFYDNFHGHWGICGDFNNDIKGKWAFFTWNNKQVPRSSGFSKIDRFLVNEDWMDQDPDAYAHFMPKSLIIILLEPVQSVWNTSVAGTLMYQLVSKLKLLKKPLKVLNRNRFSDVEKAVGIAHLLLEELQLKMHDNPSDIEILAAGKEAAENYRHLCKVQHSFLSQKAKIEWIKYGDENTKFFS
ncbi:uncharacterized protein LOC141620131 [Silene latifolia]|uniref:uncharacterized protein LOC141620131 n=1 Tax=Silene latifolia TaxID=37657 RepID=UPI003D78798B